MKTLKIKLTGTAAQVLTMTKNLESWLGIEHIHQMSGMIKVSNDECIRYIDVYPSPLEAWLIDNNNQLIKGNLVSVKDRKEAVNG